VVENGHHIRWGPPEAWQSQKTFRHPGVLQKKGGCPRPAAVDCAGWGKACLQKSVRAPAGEGRGPNKNRKNRKTFENAHHL